MDIKIDYLFSSNKKIGSRLISWGSSLFPKHVENLSNIPSHVAILIQDGLVVESVLESGVRIIPYSAWLKKNTLLYKISAGTVNKLYIDVLLEEMWGKKYDWFGILYFAKCMLNNYIFNRELPKQNKWERENYFFCTEFAARLTGVNYSMTTPAKMCNDLIGQQHEAIFN